MTKYESVLSKVLVIEVWTAEQQQQSPGVASANYMHHLDGRHIEKLWSFHEIYPPPTWVVGLGIIMQFKQTEKS